MMNLIKKTISIFCIMTVLIGCLTACQSSVSDNIAAPPVVSTEHYDFINENGESVLVLKAPINHTTSDTLSTSQLAPSLSFGSLTEMKEKMLSGTITEEQLKELNRFSKDATTGKIKLYNLNQLFEPNIPSATVSSVVLRPVGYAVIFTLNDSSTANFFVYDKANKSHYDYYLKEAVDPTANTTGITVTKRESLIDRNSEAVYYESNMGKFKNIIYSFQNESGSFLVSEKYYLDHSLIPVSDTIPYSIQILVQTEEEVYGEILWYNITDRPTMEELSSIQFRPFAGNPSNDHVTE